MLDRQALKALHSNDDDADARPLPQWFRQPIIYGVSAVLLVVAAILFLRDPPAPKSNEASPSPVSVATANPSPTASKTAPAILSASGYVVARRKATAASKVVGRINEVLIEEGMRVEAGQILARLDDSALRAEEALAASELAAAEARVSEAEVSRAESQRNYDRADALHKKGFASEAAFDQAAANLKAQEARLETATREADVQQQQLSVVRQKLDDMIIRAPFSGIVISQDAQPGEIVSPSTAGGGFTRTGIGTIVDISSLEVEVDLNESFIHRVSPGQAAETVLDAYPDWRIPSHVINIVPTANRQKATVKVRIGFDAVDPRILPDMGVQVWFFEADQNDAANTDNRSSGP